MNIKELQSQKFWLMWRLEEKNNKKTKVPYSPIDNTKCGTNEKYKGKWTTFVDAQRAKQKNNANGTGFVLPVGCFFLDIDHADLNNDKRVETMLKRFNSYAEKSQSGEGLHIYGTCDLTKIQAILKDEKGNFLFDEKGKIRFDREKYYMKNPNNGMELYLGGITNRFAAFTENSVNNLELNDCTEAVIETLEKDMRKDARKKSDKAKANYTQISNDAFTIVSDLRRFSNGPVFSRLYDNGDFSGYGSQSEADLALCSLIAFRTGDDPSMIDSIFRNSALYRKKWERKDYREQTIQKALSVCGGNFYSPNYSNHPDENFVEKPDFIEGKTLNTFGKFVSKKYQFCTFKKDKETGKQYPVKPIDENIKNFILENNIIIVVQGKIYIYTNGVYKLDDDGIFTRNLIGKCLPVEICNSSHIDRIFKLLLYEYKIHKKIEDLNKCPQEWINFTDCLLDVITLKKHAHRPEYLLINQIPWKCPDLTESADIIERIKTSSYNRFVGGMVPDKDDRLMIMAAFGVSITRITYFQILIFILGLPGVGKSTLLWLQELMVGPENCSHIPLQRLSGDGSRFAVTGVLGKLVNICADIDNTPVIDPGLIKTLSGEDMARGEYKHGNDFDFRSYARLIFSCNEMPVIHDKSNGIFRRLLILKIEQQAEHIDDLKNELEKDIDLFIRECVLSLNQTIKDAPNDAFLSPNCLNLVKEYRFDCDCVQQFLEERCQFFDNWGSCGDNWGSCGDETGADKRIEAKKLFEAFDGWRWSNRMPEISNKAFYKSLKTKGFDKYKYHGVFCYKGIKLKDIKD